MGLDNKAFLPAPTDSPSEEEEGGSLVTPTDLATDVSRRTDRSSYSIPEDGTPLTIPTKKIRSRKAASGSDSQTSLLIEYFEGGRGPDGKSKARPSVRVKVTPHQNKKSGTADSVQITEYGKDRKPAHTRRISLGGKQPPRAKSAAESSQPPIEVELLDPSELSIDSRTKSILPTSDISSMPGGSVLDAPIRIKQPGPSLEHEPSPTMDNEISPTTKTAASTGAAALGASAVAATLKAPDGSTDRSLSRERIAKRIMDKLREEPDADLKKSSRRRPTTSGSDDRTDEMRSRRSSHSARDYDDSRLSAGDSSYLRPRETESNISGVSSNSISNNPKLLKTVEDVVRRLILPEIQDIKRQQSVRSSKYDRDSLLSESDVSRSAISREGKSGTKPKLTLSRDDREHGTTISSESERKHRKHRRTSRESEPSRRSSVDSVTREKERLHKQRDRDRAAELGALGAAAAGAGLTAEALRSHNSRSSVENPDHERRERRKKRSKSKSRSESVATDEAYYNRNREIPPLPMNSEIGDSDLTRSSILSAESETTEQPAQKVITRDSAKAATPIQEVARGSPKNVTLPDSRATSRTPTTTRERPLSPSSQKSPAIRAQRSDRSISTKARAAALAAAGLGGAGAALYGHDRVRSTERLSDKNRSASPISPFTSVKPTIREADISPSTKEPPEANHRSHESKDSVDSSLKAYPMTQKRHKGINLEMEEDGVNHSNADAGNKEPLDRDDDFFERQSEINNQYRLSGDYSENRDSATYESRPWRKSTGVDSFAPSYDAAADGQDVRDVSANPDVIHTPQTIESNVASLVDPSTVASSHSGGNNQRFSQNSEAESFNQSYDPAYAVPRKPVLGEHDNASAERWNALRGQAQKLSEEGKTRSMKSDEALPAMGASGIPDMSDPMPDAAFAVDNQSEISTNPSETERNRKSSYIESPLGGTRYSKRDKWSYDNTSSGNKLDRFIDDNSLDEEFVTHDNTALMGAAAAGLGIGGAALIAANEHPHTYGQVPPKASVASQKSASLEKMISPRDTTYNQQRDTFIEEEAMTPPPAPFKDEGYDTGAHPRSPDAPTPLSFSKPPPQLFDEKDMMAVNRNMPKEDPFTSKRHMRHLSADSHGMGSPMYDSATGRGINNIQSKDVVALMDHLTVRDGQRNARDTEILVTLVRSAAEMRNNFDEMKRFIEQQNSMAMQRSDAGAEKTINKLLSNRSPSANNLRSQRSSASDPDQPGKKRNIFQRALRGLSSRNSNDIERIEDMLMQLLDEMEQLKATTGLLQTPVPPQAANIPPSASPAVNARKQPRSLDSYERLRSAPDSGYEPSGRAGTATSQSGNLSNSPASRQAQRMHSGYDISRGADRNGFSPVLEGDEEHFDHKYDDYENDDGMLTPTQEAQQQRMDPSFNTPASKTTQFKDLSPLTPRTGGEQSSKHKSNASSTIPSSTFPKVSRWSKTTASSGPADRASYQQNRPYSEISRSGSDVNILPGHDRDGDYIPAEEERLRSPSPLIPAEENVDVDDPKYRANRHTLDLQHPIPRAGQAPGYQSHLESQAKALAKLNGLGEPLTPDSDAFGSNPTLGRFNRHSGGSNYRNTMSPISDGAYSAKSGDDNVHEAQARSVGPPRPPKIREDGPLIPSSNRASASNPTAPVHPQSRYYDGASDVSDGESLNSAADQTRQKGRSVGKDYDDEPWIEPIPLERRVSPYSPGGLLAPIPERLSLESSSVRRSDSNRYTQVTDDDDDPDRSRTPVGAASQAIGASGSPTARKITGPREMPQSSHRRSGSNGGQRGTVRRKPNPWD